MIERNENQKRTKPKEKGTRKYINSFTTPDQQIEILKQRGLIIEDAKANVTEEKAKKYLTLVGYSRLNQYLFVMEDRRAPKIHIQISNPGFEPFKISKYVCPFKSGSKFIDAIRLFEFDQRLRITVLYALTRIEVAIATTWANLLAEKYGPHGYMNRMNFFNGGKEDKKAFNHFISFNNLVAKIEKEEYTRYHPEIKKYIANYDNPPYPPIWSVVSLMSLGELIQWILNTKESFKESKKVQKIQKEIKEVFNSLENNQKDDILNKKQDIPIKKTICRMLNLPPSHEFLKSFLGNFRVLRNMCAHNTRLWNQELNNDIAIIRTEPLFSAFNCTSKDIEQKKINQNTGEKKIIYKANPLDRHLYNEFILLAHIMKSLEGNYKWAVELLQLINTYLDEEKLTDIGFPKGWKKTDFWQPILYKVNVANKTSVF